MSEVRLYQLPHSPFCLSIAQVLCAWQIPFVPVNVSNGDRRQVIELTGGASYEVPVLVHRERVVYERSADSQDVAHYLDATFAGGALFPESSAGLQGILIPHLEREVEGLTFRLTDIHFIPRIPDLTERVMVIRHKERRFGRGCLEQWQRERETLTTQVTEVLRPYDQMLAQTSFLLGTRPVYSDFLLHGILQNLTWNDWNPLPPLPRIQDWFQRLRSYRHG